nr:MULTISPECIES: SRPBCC domain-containing protein [Protofrankia]
MRGASVIRDDHRAACRCALDRAHVTIELSGRDHAHADHPHDVGTYLHYAPQGEVSAGQMVMTTTLADADGGTDVLIVHEGIPDGVPAADNETGTRMALAGLAQLVESHHAGG